MGQNWSLSTKFVSFYVKTVVFRSIFWFLGQNFGFKVKIEVQRSKFVSFDVKTVIFRSKFWFLGQNFGFKVKIEVLSSKLVSFDVKTLVFRSKVLFRSKWMEITSTFRSLSIDFRGLQSTLKAQAPLLTVNERSFQWQLSRTDVPPMPEKTLKRRSKSTEIACSREGGREGGS